MGSALLVAVAVGVAVAVQVAVLGGVTRRMNPLGVSLALQVAGVVAGALWATAAGGWQVVPSAMRSWWWVPLGVVGWILVAALGYASGRIGVTVTLGVAVAVQLVVGLLFDVVRGQTVFGPRPLVGVLLLVAGVGLVLPRS
jgi:transporter family-2 protein